MASGWKAEREVACEAVLAGARAAIAAQAHLDVREKNRFDLITEADLACQRLVMQHLQARFPKYSFVSEEMQPEALSADVPLWVLDPIDGTTSFVHGYPGFTVSLALYANNELALGLILDPSRQELFWAECGQGAWLGSERLRTSTVDNLEQALLATEFPYGIKERRAHLQSWNALCLKTQGVRVSGSTALDLAYVAAGRVDGFWELGSSHFWDIAAGIVLVREAGGQISDISGGALNLDHPRPLATNGALHEILKEELGPFLADRTAPP